MAPEPDADLLQRFVQGDREAFELLFRRYQAEVHRWIVRIIRDSSAADDVLVESFWRAYRARARFEWSRSFGAWIRRIATNAARDHLRTVRRRYPSALPAPPPADPPVDDNLATIALAFERLPPRLNMVARLALIEDCPHAEIADALGIPVGTVKSRLFRAQRLLREELARLGIRP
jgi:RNA polymerase sigma factor (sigma-70 family)